LLAIREILMSKSNDDKHTQGASSIVAGCKHKHSAPSQQTTGVKGGEGAGVMQRTREKEAKHQRAVPRSQQRSAASIGRLLRKLCRPARGGRGQGPCGL
jgi:hypothetical protein